MRPQNAKTVRLSSGAHRAPSEGVCTLELCSMLAGERFSDRPHCACPVLAAFARAYNDGLDEHLRQQLTRLALVLVDSRTDDPEWRRRRADALLAFAEPAPQLRGRLARTKLHGLTGSLTRAGARCAIAAREDEDAHLRTLALLEQLAAPASSPLNASLREVRATSFKHDDACRPLVRR